MAGKTKEVPDAGIPGSVNFWEIARTFLAIGLASFSLAALGETREWITQRRKWLADEEFLKGMALAQLLPGAPTVNLCSYLGYRLRGLTGAALATVFFLVPSFLSMLGLSYMYLHYGGIGVISRLFHGLAALVVGLVFNTILNLWQSGVKTRINWFLALTGFAMAFWLRMGVIEVLLFAGSVSLILVLLSRRSIRLAGWFGLGSHVPAGEVVVKVAPPEDSARPATVFPSPVADSPRWLPSWRVVTELGLSVLLILVAQYFLLRSRPQLLPLGTSFMRIGALVFGSGYAMLPFIQDAAVNHFAWLTNQQFAAALALSLTTPGPVTIIGVFIGYKAAGLSGSIVGMVDMYLPAWVMTILAAGPYARVGGSRMVKQVIGGIVAAFIGTLWVVLIRLAAGSLVDGGTWALAVAALTAQRFGKIRTIWVVVAGAVVSLALFH